MYFPLNKSLLKYVFDPKRSIDCRHQTLFFSCLHFITSSQRIRLKKRTEKKVSIVNNLDSQKYK